MRPVFGSRFGLGKDTYRDKHTSGAMCGKFNVELQKLNGEDIQNCNTNCVLLALLVV